MEADRQGDQTAQDEVPQALAVVVHVESEVGHHGGHGLAEPLCLLLSGVRTVVEEGSETANPFLSVSGI